MNDFREIRNKSVLVTGSSGFLGRHLCSKLMQLGADILGIDSVPPNVEKTKNDTKGHFYRQCNLADKSQILKVFEEGKFDFIFHLAAIASPRTCKSNFDLAYDVNITGTKNILSSTLNSTRIVCMSSASVYGNPVKLPIPEDHPLNGSDPYSITKIIGEQLCHNYVNNYERNISIARNFNAFGIGQTTEYIVPTLITQALKNRKIEIWNSDPVRDLMYVDDTINALITIGIYGDNTVYNIGSGIGTRIGTLAESIRGNIDPEIEIVDLRKDVIGSSSLISDNTKLRELGWSQKMEFDTGISKTIDWFKSL